MGGEMPGYKPEDILQTTGENMGAIKDLDLAEKMATAENKTRSKDEVINKFKSALGMISDYAGYHAANARRNAFEQEIDSRIEEKAKAEGVTDQRVVREEKLFAKSDIDRERIRLYEENDHYKRAQAEREREQAQAEREIERQRERLRS